MTKFTKTLIGKEAREALKRGIDAVYKPVSATLGARGRNGIYREWGLPHITNDGVSIARKINPQDKFERMGADLIKQISEQTNTEVGDGPQPLDSRILSPNGYIRFRDIKIGDKICGTQGSTQEVLGVFPKGKKQIFKVKFSDGREIECSGDHLWLVTTYWGIKKILTTRQLLNNKLFNNNGNHKQYKYYVPIDKIEFSKKELSIDPYTLGVLLGDGSLSGLDSTEISLGLNKEHIIEKLQLPDGLYLNTAFVEDKKYFRIKINGKTQEGKSIRDLLQELGLQGTTSHTKFIPHRYLFSDMNDRLSLLQGLSDTDGYINQRNLLEYSTVSKQLADDVSELLFGLGKSIHSYLMERKENSSYSNNSIFRISELKGYKYGNKITEVIPTDKEIEMMCIKVSNEDNLYYTDNCIITHNTTTSIVLGHALIEKGGESDNPMKLKRELEEEKNIVVKKIKERSIPAKGYNELLNVAQISTEDKNLALVTTDAITKAGKHGAVITEEGAGYEIETESTQGYFWEKGFISPYMITNPDKNEAVLENPSIIVTDRYMNLNKDLMQTLNDIKAHGINSAFIIVDQLEGELLQSIIVNRMKGIFTVVAVRRPGTLEELEDIATLVGATAVTKDKGIKDITFQHTGKANKIIATKDKITILADKTISLEKRIENIQSELKKDKDNELLKTRIAKLTDGIVVIRVGAKTEAERKYKKDKIDDAVCACKAALEEGIVAGAGTTLYEIAQEIKHPVMKYALEAPYKKILENAGIKPDGLFYDVNTGKKTKDLIKSGIINPAKVERSAVENAVSLASSLLTVESVIAEFEEKSEKEADSLM